MYDEIPEICTSRSYLTNIFIDLCAVFSFSLSFFSPPFAIFHLFFINFTSCAEPAHRLLETSSVFLSKGNLKKKKKGEKKSVWVSKTLWIMFNYIRQTSLAELSGKMRAVWVQCQAEKNPSTWHFWINVKSESLSFSSSHEASNTDTWLFFLFFFLSSA